MSEVSVPDEVLVLLNMFGKVRRQGRCIDMYLPDPRSHRPAMMYQFVYGLYDARGVFVYTDLWTLHANAPKKASGWQLLAASRNISELVTVMMDDWNDRRSQG